MRDAAGIVDLSAFAIFDVVGPGALDAVQRSCVAQCDVAVGKVIYTPVLDASGGFVSDLTVMRLGHDHFRVVTGGAHGMVDRKWFADLAPRTVRRRRGRPDRRRTPRSACGARAPATSWPRSPRPTSSNEGFGFGTCRDIEVDSLAVLASRISYVGELGWELYVPIEQGARLWTIAARGRRGARRHPGRHRGLRHDRPDREGLPRVRLRARRRAHHRRGGHAAAQGEGGRLRRQGGLPQAARRGTRHRALHADRRRPHVDVAA